MLELSILVNAVLGGGVAEPYNLQSALARLNPFSRLSECLVCLMHVVLTFGSCAMETHELCQVRKEAALSGIFHVPQDRLDRAGDMGNAYVRLSEEGARHYIDNSTRPNSGRVFLLSRFEVLAIECY